MPDIPYIGKANSLPAGWHLPTAGLVRKYGRGLELGLAPESAPHTRTAAQRFEGSTPPIQAGLTQLETFVALGHEFSALGMAYPQLAIAAETGNFMVFAAMTDIAGLKAEDRRTGQLFLNPFVKPVTSKGKAVGGEPCFTCLSGCLVAEVERWRAVMLTSDNQPPLELEGAAAIVAQHEYDHLLGKLCVDVAFRSGLNVFYVPVELRDVFFAEFYHKNRLHDWPFRFIQEQWEATLSGEYSPLHYAHLL